MKKSPSSNKLNYLYEYPIKTKPENIELDNYISCINTDHDFTQSESRINPSDSSSNSNIGSSFCENSLYDGFSPYDYVLSEPPHYAFNTDIDELQIDPNKNSKYIDKLYKPYKPYKSTLLTLIPIHY